MSHHSANFSLSAAVISSLIIEWTLKSTLNELKAGRAHFPLKEQGRVHSALPSPAPTSEAALPSFLNPKP
jgi:hypothetical protein